MALDVLIVGSGGREHALAWKLKQSPRIGKLYVAPGNGGTASIAENVAIDVMDFSALTKFAEEKKIGLTVVGPDDPLAAGIVDAFKARGLRVWGPVKAAAQIEASKAFAKEFMQEAGIPTAEFKIFTSAGDALTYVHSHGAPIVVKASGLALGKGVYVCRTIDEAGEAIDAIMVKRVHKDAGKKFPRMRSPMARTTFFFHRRKTTSVRKTETRDRKPAAWVLLHRCRGLLPT
jgi:phosphoribosylamine--glycine ligase